jgi:ubiquinone/menaquinone biosynthesis C-methylase UbiE
MVQQAFWLGQRLLLGSAVLVITCVFFLPPAAALTDTTYTYKKPSFDGTGKVYRGREIAEVMGYQGASWLERPERMQSEQPQKLVAALALQPDDTVAEIGAGTGLISELLMEAVPEGQVLAVDIQPEMVAFLRKRLQQRHLTNIVPILGTEQSPNLPPHSIDLAIFVDAYHELAYPREMMQAVVEALKPNGRVALVEYRAEDPFVFIKPHHKMSEAQAKQEIAAVGLRWLKTDTILPQQHLLLFTTADRNTPQSP